MGASRRTGAAVVALALGLLAGCSGGDGPVRRNAVADERPADPGPSTSTTAPAGPATTAAPPPPPDGAPPAPGSGADAPHPPTPPEGVSTAESGEREFAYTMRRDSPAFKNQNAPVVAVQRVQGDTMTVRWRFKYDSFETTRTLRSAGGTWSGAFFEDMAIEWTDCAWLPAATYVPELRVGNRVALDTKCEVDWEGDPNPVYHLTGEVKVVGQKSVTIAGKPYEVWVIERAYRLVASGGTSADGEFTTNALWSPDLKMIVRQDATGRGSIGTSTASNTAHIEMDGLQE